MSKAMEGSMAAGNRRVMLALVLAFVAGFGYAQNGPDSGVLKPVGDIASRSLALLAAADPSGAAGALAGFESAWAPVEDAVRARNLDVYARVEVGFSRAMAALEAQPPNTTVAAQALQGLAQAVRDYSNGAEPAGQAVEPRGLSALVTLLRQVRDALLSEDMAQASDLMESFQGVWPLAEGEVKTRSAETYAMIETETTRAASLILSGPDGSARALEILGAMLAQLENLPRTVRYSVWDAGLILLREGMEALLILAALLAALRKAGSTGGARWVWLGAGTGFAASGIFAVVLVLVIAAATAGSTRETVEGAVGLAAVGFMLTVGAWLHGRANLQAWSGFMKGKVGTAIASGRMWALFSLALLAVLREGAEAAVFYVGIAAGITNPQLVAGIAGALVLLIITGFLVIRLSVRLPLHWVFLAATALIYYLAFKITGESVRALQTAGVLPTHFADRLPSVGFLGMSPTWEAFVPQAVVLALVIGEIVLTESRHAGSRKTPPASTAR